MTAPEWDTYVQLLGAETAAGIERATALEELSGGRADAEAEVRRQYRVVCSEIDALDERRAQLVRTITDECAQEGLGNLGEADTADAPRAGVESATDVQALLVELQALLDDIRSERRLLAGYRRAEERRRRDCEEQERARAAGADRARRREQNLAEAREQATVRRRARTPKPEAPPPAPVEARSSRYPTAVVAAAVVAVVVCIIVVVLLL